MRPSTCDSTGTPGTRSWFDANAYSPATVEPPEPPSGTSKRIFSAPLPVACAPPSAPPIHPPTGLVSMKCRNSAVGPVASPSTLMRVTLASRSSIAIFVRPICAPYTRPFVMSNATFAPSKRTSPSMSVTAGQPAA